jgi:hypothetical protein
MKMTLQNGASKAQAGRKREHLPGVPGRPHGDLQIPRSSVILLFSTSDGPLLCRGIAYPPGCAYESRAQDVNRRMFVLGRRAAPRFFRVVTPCKLPAAARAGSVQGAVPLWSELSRHRWIQHRHELKERIATSGNAQRQAAVFYIILRSIRGPLEQTAVLALLHFPARLCPAVCNENEPESVSAAATNHSCADSF